MNTKIVYVAVSDEEDLYLEETFVSIYSLRLHNPKAVVYLVVDEKTDSTIRGKRSGILKYVDHKIVVPIQEPYNKVERSRYLKTRLREYIQGVFFYLDSDTVVVEDLSELDKLQCDIAAVISDHVPVNVYYDFCGNNVKKYARQEGWKCAGNIPYFNGGALFVKDSELAHSFYKDWHSRWKDCLQKYGRHNDQPPLAWVNEKYNYVITELPGIWNCQILTFSLPFIHEAKIIHYFSLDTNYNNRLIHAFRDKGIYMKVREVGEITDDIEQQIIKAKSLYLNPTRICRPNEVAFLSGETAQVCLNHERMVKVLNCVFRILLKIYFVVSKIKNR